MSSLGVPAFILTLLVMIVFHEFGHFSTAKAFGIKVEQFFVGFGPRLFSRTRGETEYGVKAILLGGYVKIAGMNPWQTVPESDLPRTYGAKPAWQRAIVLAAGSTTHFILAAVILALTFGIAGVPGDPTTRLESVRTGVPEAGDPAAKAGLRPGDRIVSIAGEPISRWEQVRRAVRDRPGAKVDVVVLRDGQRLSFRVTLAGIEVKGEPGAKKTIGFLGVVPEIEMDRLSPPAAVWKGVATTGELIGLSVKGTLTIFSPQGISRVFSAIGEDGDRGLDQPIGLVGGARLAGQAARAGEFEALLSFLTGFIVFVGVINLMPLPPLDGGHLAVLAIEKVTGRRIDMRRVVPVAAVVLVFFVALSFALLYLDILRPVANPFQ